MNLATSIRAARPRRWRRLSSLPRLVLAAGVLFTLWLQAGIPGPVFLNGDAGARYLLTRQFAAGSAAVDLRLPAEPWAQALWDAGLYPITHPNVVVQDGRRFALYPFALPLLSAPLFSAFGYRGLYLLPLLATWATWLLFLRACRNLRLGPRASGLALAGLVFASPLTLYSGMFWEHAPAVTLAFAGCLLVLLPRAGQVPSSRAALAGGLLFALAALLREELSMVCALVGAALVLALLRGRPTWLAGHARATLAGLALGTGLVLAINLAGYGHPLGVHAAVVLGHPHWVKGSRLWPALRVQSLGLVEYFPLLLVAAGLPLALRGRRPDPRPLALLALALTLAVAIPLLVRADGGRQWGPRFVFICLPLLSLCAGVVLEAQRRVRSRALRGLAWAACGAALAWGAWLNSVVGSDYVRANLQRRLTAFNLVSAAAERHVAVSRDSAALQLAALVGPKTFFLTEQTSELRNVARAMAATGRTDLLYLCHSGYSCGPFGEEQRRVRLEYAGSDDLLGEFVLIGTADRYLVYRGRIHARDE